MCYSIRKEEEDISNLFQFKGFAKIYENEFEREKIKLISSHY